MKAADPSLRLIVLRTKKMKRAKAFYGHIGLAFTREQHGAGPVHYSAALGETVLEIYPADKSAKGDGVARLGFAVSDVRRVLSTLEATGAPFIQHVRKTKYGEVAVVRDPDGRSVELVQKR